MAAGLPDRLVTDLPAQTTRYSRCRRRQLAQISTNAELSDRKVFKHPYHYLLKLSRTAFTWQRRRTHGDAATTGVEVVGHPRPREKK